MITSFTRHIPWPGWSCTCIYKQPRMIKYFIQYPRLDLFFTCYRPTSNQVFTHMRSRDLLVTYCDHTWSRLLLTLHGWTRFLLVSRLVLIDHGLSRPLLANLWWSRLTRQSPMNTSRTHWPWIITSFILDNLWWSRLTRHSPMNTSRTHWPWINTSFTR